MRWLWIIPVLLALIAHLHVLQNGFVWDDEVILQNLHVFQQGHDLILPNLIMTQLEGPAVGPYFRPLFSASLLFDYKLWGDNPSGYHFTALVIHLINTGLVFFLARELIHHSGPAHRVAPADASGPIPHALRPTPHVLAPFIASSLFAVDPAHSEAVAWIAARSDILCMMLMAVALLLYIRFSTTGNFALFGFSMLAFGLALLTKETALGLLFLFPLYSYYFSSPKRAVWRMSTGLLVPLLIFGIYLWIRLAKMTAASVGQFHLPDGFSFLIFTKALSAYGLYLKLLVFPYPHNPFISSLPQSHLFLLFSALAVFVLCTWLFIAMHHRDVVSAIGLVWTAVLLVPPVLVAIYPISPVLAADRYIYGPSLGFFIAAAYGLSRFREQFRRFVGIPQFIVIAVIVLWGWQSWNRDSIWRDPLTFWSTAATAAPESDFVHRELGLEYHRLGRYLEAELHYRQALTGRMKTLPPDHPERARSLHDLAVLYHGQARYSEAEPLYLQARSIWEKAPGSPDLAGLFYNLAELYRTQGRYADAEVLHRNAIDIRMKTLGPNHPDLASSLYNLALLYETQARYREAEPLYRRAVSILEKTQNADSPLLSMAREQYARLLKKMNGTPGQDLPAGALERTGR